MTTEEADGSSAPADLARRAVRGTAAITLSSYAQLGIQVAVSIALARMLKPSDFGAVALAGTIYSFLSKSKDWGLRQALVHRQEDIQSYLATHRTLNVGTSVILLIIAGLGWWAAARIWSPLVAALLIISAALAVGRALGETHDALLEKELEYVRRIILGFVIFLVSSTLSVLMAWQGYGLWSLVAGNVAGTIMFAVGTPLICGQVIPFRIDREALRFFLGFGPWWRWVLASTSTTVVFQFDDLLVGSMKGQSMLGFYERAYSWARIPTDRVAHLVTGAAFPTYAKLQADRERLSRTFELLLSAVVRLSLPLGLLIVLVAREGTLVVLGEKWLPMVPALQLLCIYCLLRPVFDDCGALLTAIGKPVIANNVAMVRAAWVLLTCPAAVHFWGMNGAAVCVGIAMILGVLLIYRSILKVVSVNWRRTLLGPVVATGGAGLACWWVGEQWMLGTSLLLVVRAATFTMVYLGVEGVMEGRYLLQTFRRVWEAAR